MSLTVDKAALTTARDRLMSEKTLVDAALDDTGTGSLPAQKAACQQRIAGLQGQLDAPNKRFQEYNEALRFWQEKGLLIEGAADKPDTLKGYEAQLSYLKAGLPGDIEKLRTQRRDIARGIHKCVAAIRDAYKELFSAVQELIGSSVIIKEGFKLTFESSIIERNLEGDLFDKFVSTGVAGSFYRKKKGTALEEIRADFNVSDEDEALAYVEKIIAYLERDMRTAQQTPTHVAGQLRKNVDVKALYDFLWGLGQPAEPRGVLKDGQFIPGIEAMIACSTAGRCRPGAARRAIPPAGHPRPSRGRISLDFFLGRRRGWAVLHSRLPPQSGRAGH